MRGLVRIRTAPIIEGAAGMAPERIIALVSAAFPNATVGEVRDALKAHAADSLAKSNRLRAEAQFDLRLADLCDPVMTAGRADTVGEALRVLADEGNEDAEAYRIV